MLKKLISLMLCVVMVVSLLPIRMQTISAKTLSMTEVQTVYLGASHSAAIKKDGSLWLWGDNRYGAIGDGTTVNRHSPVKILDNVMSISLNPYRSAAIKDDGTLWMWGVNDCGQIGDGTKDNKYTPVKIMDNVASVLMYGYVSAAIKKDGSLWMWGLNDMMQIGNRRPGDDYSGRNVLTPVKIMDDVVSISLGTYHGAAIKKDGTLWMWGDNGYGQIGMGKRIGYSYPVKVMENVESVSLGSYYSAAIKKDGTLWMWGKVEFGRIGGGTVADILSPVKIMDDAESVKLYDEEGAAIKKDGSLWMWGLNKYGQSGRTRGVKQLTPVKIMDDVVSISLSGHSAAIKKDGSLWLWGNNNAGQIGDGTYTTNPRPTRIMDDVVSVRVAGSVSAAIKEDGSLWMWGDNNAGQIGDGTFESKYTPIKIMVDIKITRDYDKKPVEPEESANKSTNESTKDEQNIRVWVNDKIVSFDQPPLMINDRTLVPLRAIFQELGAAVLWDKDTQTITAIRGATEIKLTIGEARIFKDGKEIVMDVPAQIINSRTLVPVRAIAESLNCLVTWFPKERIVRIIEKNKVMLVASTLAELEEKGNNGFSYEERKEINNTVKDALIELDDTLDFQETVLLVEGVAFEVASAVLKSLYSGGAGASGDVEDICKNVADIFIKTGALGADILLKQMPDEKSFIYNFGMSACQRQEEILSAMASLHKRITSDYYTEEDAAAYVYLHYQSMINTEHAKLAITLLQDELPHGFFEGLLASGGAFVKAILPGLSDIMPVKLNLYEHVYLGIVTEYCKFACGETNDYINTIKKAFNHPVVDEWAENVNWYTESMNEILMLTK